MLESGQQLGHYKIRSQIGAGGMGEVYLAEDLRLERKVALKILSSALSRDQNSMRRFEQEALSASALNHPNILTVYEFTEQDNLRLLATEFVQGKTLREKLNNEGVNFDEALNIAQQIAFALAAAHSAGIAHRDIKPENVMLRDDGIVKILDFGLAKLTQEKTDEIESITTKRSQIKTQAGTILGTIFYISPEQAQGNAIDGRTDIWSLGVVMYEMLTGKMPFSGATITEILVSILTKEPKSPSELSDKIPASLEYIVNKSLKKIKEERYQTAKDLLSDLKNLQKRLDFEAELELSSPPNRQTDEIPPIFEGNVTEKISIVKPNNLSAELSPIIGREKETAELRDLLKRENARLVTLTGVGGTGKTSLAKAVARKMLADFADGVFFVELAAITNIELVLSTVAQSLDVKEAGGKPILQVLKDFLRDKQMLLVIDNFEQVIEAAPQIAELIASAVNLKILITSRVLLHVSVEREFAVPPLSTPDETERIPIDELLKYEAIRLFVERARNLKPNFTLTHENAQAVAEICARLEGLPLAIELAAARVKFLSPQLIFTKLENRLKLLTGGARDLPARQQTMRGAVEWSYDLLTDEERCLFRQLAAFAGGFTLEAAEAVVNCQLPINFQGETSEQQTIKIKQLPIDTLDGVTSLVDKSLLVSKEQSSGETRFRMLEVVREYALELLTTRGEANAMRYSHADYFLALGEEAEPHLTDAQAVNWLNRLEDEHDNLRTALQFLLEHDTRKGERLTSALRLFWTSHSHLTEGRKWLEEALERGGIDTPSTTRFKMLNALAYLALNQGDYETAERKYRQGLAEGEATKNLRQIAVSNRGLGMVVFGKGDIKAARKFVEAGLAISREVNEKYVILLLLEALADIARTEGNNAEARTLFEEALTIAGQLGYELSESGILCNLGAVAHGEGDYKAAHSHFAEALKTFQKLGDKTRISYSLDGIAAVAAERGEFERATKLAGAAECLRQLIGYKSEPADRFFRDTYLAKLRAETGEDEFAKAYEQGCRMNIEEAIAIALR